MSLSLQIALESVCVIDEGETVLVEGLRVAPSERGKGVAGVLLKFCSQFIKARYPEVKVTRLTRDDKLGPKDFQKYRLITKQVPESIETHTNIHIYIPTYLPAYLPTGHTKHTNKQSFRPEYIYNHTYIYTVH